MDIILGEPLFSSENKYNSGSGWPSFTGVLPNVEITEIVDKSYGMTRIEVTSRPCI